jgi:hypothetical protein
MLAEFFLDQAITFNWVIIFERENIKRANNRFRGESREEHLADVPLRETEATSASQLFLAVKMIHASYTQFHNVSPHFLPYISNVREPASMNFQAPLSPLVGKRYSPFCFLKSRPHIGFYIADAKYSKRYRCVK